MMQPWERQPDESGKAWEAFRIYRDLGPGRSLSEVASILGKSRQSIGGWAARHNWAWRAQEYDRYLDEQRVRAQVRQIQEMSERHAEQSQLIMNALMTPIHALLKRLSEDPEALDKLSSRELADLIQLCNRVSATFPVIAGVERAARGQIPTATLNQAAKDISEKIEKYRRLVERAQKAEAKPQAPELKVIPGKEGQESS